MMQFCAKLAKFRHWMEKQKRDRVWMAPLQTHHIRTPHDRQEAREGQMKDRRLINGGLNQRKSQRNHKNVFCCDCDMKAQQKLLRSNPLLILSTIDYFATLFGETTFVFFLDSNVCKEYLAGSFPDLLKIHNNTYSRTKCYKTNGNKDQQKIYI